MSRPVEKYYFSFLGLRDMMKLLIADDHALVRDALKSHIERVSPETTVLTAASVDEAASLINDADDDPFSLVILDLWMPGMDGLGGVRRVTGLTETPVAVMSGHAEPDDIAALMEAGAVGFVPKTLDGATLLDVIEAFADGRSADLTGILADQFIPEDVRQRLPQGPLSRKETDVVGHLLLGMSNKEIARCLCVEEVTVKLHIKNICRKLEARNRTHAALQAMKIGYPAAVCPRSERDPERC